LQIDEDLKQQLCRVITIINNMLNEQINLNDQLEKGSIDPAAKKEMIMQKWQCLDVEQK
jgi:hypothetical protein